WDLGGPKALDPEGSNVPAVCTNRDRRSTRVASGRPSPYHFAMFQRSHPYLYAPLAGLLFAVSLGAGPSAAAPGRASASGGPTRPGAPAALGWERKLDPFLRRAALGVERRQGAFTDRLPARSREAIATLPPFVRAERDGDDPIFYVKARLRDDVG